MSRGELVSTAARLTVILMALAVVYFAGIVRGATACRIPDWLQWSV